MTLSTAVGIFTANSGTGTQAVTGVGFQPAAVLFWWSSHTSVGTTVNGRFGQGFTDGTNDGAACTAWEDSASTTSNTRERITNAACITLVDETGTLLMEAAISSLDSDGFTLNWTTAGGSRKIAYLALGGVSAYVGSQALTLSSGSQAVTGVGFALDALMMLGVEVATASGTTLRGGHAFGVATSTSDRMTNSHRFRDGGNRDGSSGMSDQQILIYADDSAIPETKWGLTAIGSDGFTLTEDLAGNSNFTVFLALQGLEIAIGSLVQPASTGTQSVTGLSFGPDVVIFHGADQAAALDTWVASGAGATRGISDGTTEGASWAFIDQGGSARPADSAWSETKAIISYDNTSGTASLVADADVSALNSDGFTVNWTTVDTTQRRYGWIALGNPNAAGTVGTALDSTIFNSRVFGQTVVV